jgi:serine/threonine protein kinase
MSEPSQREPDFAGFEILSELGRGTTGVVYKAQDTRFSKRVVALKMPVIVSEATRSEQRERFLREARTQAALGDGPECGIPTVLLVGEHYGQAFYVREFVEGNTLEELVVADSLEIRAAVTILESVARIAHRVHARGIAHRNLVAPNILVTPSRTPKLIGFGWAGSLPHPSEAPRRMPETYIRADVDGLGRLLTWICASLQQPLSLPLQKLCHMFSSESAGHHFATAAQFADALGQ